MSEIMNLENFRELSKNEADKINGGGFVITGTMIVKGVGLVATGYGFGSWVKNKFFN